MNSSLRFRLRLATAVVGSLSLLAVPLGSLSAQPLSEVTLASDGQARMPVVVSPEATAGVREAAEELADYLGRISGAVFRVEDADAAAGIAMGQRGIVVGLVSSYTDLPFEVDFRSGAVSRDQYVLRSTGHGLYLLGTTPAH